MTKISRPKAGKVRVPSKSTMGKNNAGGMGPPKPTLTGGKRPAFRKDGAKVQSKPG